MTVTAGASVDEAAFLCPGRLLLQGRPAGARSVMGAGSSLPADKTRRDRRWLGFGLHELFQLSEDAHSTTALTEDAQRVEDIFAGAYGGSVDAGRMHGGADISMDGPIGELAAGEAVATACLAAVPIELALQQTRAWLAHDLSLSCAQSDTFQAVIAQRLHILHCVHAAMVRAWPRVWPVDRLIGSGASAASIADESADRHNVTGASGDAEGGDEDDTASRDELDTELRALPHSAQLAMRLLFGMLDAVQPQHTGNGADALRATPAVTRKRRTRRDSRPRRLLDDAGDESVGAGSGTAGVDGGDEVTSDDWGRRDEESESESESESDSESESENESEKDEEEHAAERAALLAELVPLLNELPPLSLVPPDGGTAAVGAAAYAARAAARALAPALFTLLAARAAHQVASARLRARPAHHASAARGATVAPARPSTPAERVPLSRFLPLRWERRLPVQLPRSRSRPVTCRLWRSVQAARAARRESGRACPAGWQCGRRWAQTARPPRYFGPHPQLRP